MHGVMGLLCCGRRELGGEGVHRAVLSSLYCVLPTLPTAGAAAHQYGGMPGDLRGQAGHLAGGGGGAGSGRAAVCMTLPRLVGSQWWPAEVADPCLRPSWPGLHLAAGLLPSVPWPEMGTRAGAGLGEVLAGEWPGIAHCSSLPGRLGRYLGVRQGKEGPGSEDTDLGGA